MWSDPPASELAPSACREIVNACAFTDTLVPREGMQQIPTFALPEDRTTYTCSKSGVTVTLTGHSASATNAGKYISYANGSDPDLIVSVAGGSSYTVADSSVVANTTALIRTRVWGWFHHQKRDLFLCQLGQTLYKIDPTTYLWTEIYQTGETALPASACQFRELGDHALAFNAGMFKINLDQNRYWKTNVEPAANTLVNSTYPATGNLRRYLYTMSRMSGTTPLWADRATLVIQQETGSNLQDAANIDYEEIYTGSLQECGDTTTTYQVLYTGALASTAGLTGSNLFFDVTVDGTLYTIGYSVSATASYVQIAAAIQTALRAEVGATMYCTWSPSTLKFLFRNFAAASTISYLASPGAVAGWTDISATIKGTAGTGASLTSTGYYAQAQLRQYTTNAYWKAFTHYSFYQTRSLVKTGSIITGNASAYAWMTDYPIMKPMKVTAQGTTLTRVANAGFFSQFDLGNYVTVVDATSANYTAWQRNISAYSSANTVTMDGTSGGDGTMANAWAFIGAQYGMILDSTNGDCTVQGWLDLHNSAALKYDATTGARTLAAGDPVFAADGNVYWVDSTTDAIHFRLDSTDVDMSRLPCAITPKDATSGNYYNQIKDSVNDGAVSSRIGTLGLRSRFYRAMPAASAGVVSSGFVVVGAENKVYWNNIAVDQQYIIGNDHPTYQVESLNGTVTALSVNQTQISIFTNQGAYTTQNNLELTYTDLNNGNVIYILPKPVRMDLYIGVADKAHLYEFERDMVVAINNDYGIRTWDGYKWSNNIILNKIQDKLKACAKLMVTYDERYGVLIYGSTGGYVYDKVYSVGVKEDKYVGASEFQNLPFPDLDVQPVNYDTRVLFLPFGQVAGRFDDGEVVTFLRDSTIDVPDNTVPGTGSDIPWSFTTGDDVGSEEHNTLSHLETHLYVSGRPPTETISGATTINVLAYNDIGTYVTMARSIRDFAMYKGDINFDKKFDGHRIRYKVTFDRALAVVNGMTSYYKSIDKASSLSERATEEGVYQTYLVGTVRIGISRTNPVVNLGTGKRATVTGTITRGTGPDGRTGSSYVV